jgi:MFS transporter, DHA1 family, inner membrane transport protein
MTFPLASSQRAQKGDTHVTRDNHHEMRAAAVAEEPTVAETRPASTTLIVEETRAGTRVLIALCVASFLAALNYFATTPFYPEMARDLQTTVPRLGQIVTVMVLISATCGLAIGPLADRYGFRWPLVIGLLAVGINLLGTSVVPNFPALLGFGVVGGLADAVVFGLPLAIAGTRFTGDARRHAIGWTIAAISSAPIVGVPLLTVISGVTGWRGAVAIAGLTAVGAAWFVATSLQADGQRAEARVRVQPLLAAYLPLLGHPPTLRLFGVAALRAVWWVGLLTYLGAFLADALGLSGPQIGIVYALAGGGYAAGSLVASGRLGAGSARVSIAAASLVAGLLVVPTVLIGNAWLVLSLLLALSAAAAVCSVGVTSLLVAESPAGAGTTMVLNSSLLNVGAAGGAALGGVLIAFGGYGALAFGLPLFAFAAAGLASWPGDR